MAYELVTTSGIPQNVGFVVFDGPPDGKTVMRISSMEDLSSYAAFLKLPVSEALTHATIAGWLDLPTANVWLASMPAAQQTIQSTVESDIDKILSGIKKLSVGEIAFFIGLGLIAWAAIKNEKQANLKN